MQDTTPESFALRTERLELLPLSTEHAEFLHRLWTEPSVRRFLWDDRVIEPGEVTGVVDASLASFRVHGFGMWLLRLLPNATPIGFCGLRHFGPLNEVEILYGLLPTHWGRGLATEASLAVLTYAFQLGLDRIFAGADPPNTASFRVMERLGMTYSSKRVLNGIEAEYFSIAAPLAP